MRKHNEDFNPADHIDREEVVEILKAHTRSDGSHSGMRLDTLCKRINKDFAYHRHGKVKQWLRAHRNIESTKRADFKFVSDAELEERENRRADELRKKQEKENLKEANFSTLKTLVETDDRFEQRYPQYGPETWSWSIVFDDRYSLSCSTTHKGLTVELGASDPDGPERNVLPYLSGGPKLEAEDPAQLVEVLEQFDAFVQDLLDMGGVKLGK